MEKLGHHISLDKNVFNTVVNYPKKTLQIFTGSPQSYNRSEKLAFASEASEYILKNNIHLYVHGSYVVNISNKYEECEKAMQYLKRDLKLVHDISSKGLVIHVGKYKTSTEKEGIEVMFSNVSRILVETLNEASNGKFLLETPAGQGSETLTKIEDFISFCKRFKDNKRFGLVIDTCHVFASGYDPLFYLQQIVENGLTVDLVHMNDSEKPKGSRVDRHAGIGHGLIGLEKLSECIKFCIDNEIDMVNE